RARAARLSSFSSPSSPCDAPAAGSVASGIGLWTHAAVRRLVGAWSWLAVTLFADKRAQSKRDELELILRRRCKRGFFCCWPRANFGDDLQFTATAAIVLIPLPWL